MGEHLHETGREFVYEIKEYLELTMNFEGIATAYDPNGMTIREMRNGNFKTFDLVGAYKKDDIIIEAFIEAKNYSSSSNLLDLYKKYLKECFSVWVRSRIKFAHWKARFIFLSTHPFACTKFTKLTNLDFLEDEIRNDDDLFEFFNSNKEEVRKQFLDYFDILFLNKSKELILPNIQRIVRFSKIFS